MTTFEDHQQMSIWLGLPEKGTPTSDKTVRYLWEKRCIGDLWRFVLETNLNRKLAGHTHTHPLFQTTHTSSRRNNDILVQLARTAPTRSELQQLVEKEWGLKRCHASRLARCAFGARENAQMHLTRQLLLHRNCRPKSSPLGRGASRWASWLWP